MASLNGEVIRAHKLIAPLIAIVDYVGYLEINQRVELLNQRTSVISDLLDMLKEHLNSSHGEQLEWIVIVLIFFEIVIGVVTICMDAFSFSRGGGHIKY